MCCTTPIGVGCRIVEDEFVALLADNFDEVRCRLCPHAVGEHTVVVLPDAGKFDRCPGKVVRLHEVVDEDPAQCLLYVRSWRRPAASAVRRPIQAMISLARPGSIHQDSPIDCTTYQEVRFYLAF
jgi:hypothetical protein